MTDEKIFKVNNQLLHHDWSNLEKMSVDESYTEFNRIISDTLDTFMPVKKFIIPAKRVVREKWMTNSLQRCSNKCQKLYKKQLVRPKIVMST